MNVQGDEFDIGIGGRKAVLFVYGVEFRQKVPHTMCVHNSVLNVILK